MSSYVTNKLLSLAAVFLYIFVTYLIYGNTKSQWQSILICLLIFGYAHFFVAFYYQIKSFGRSPNPTIHYYSFLALTFVSVGISFLAFKIVGFAAALFIGFLYFLLHGSLNEKTLILRQTTLNVPHGHMAALAIFFISLLIYSVPDKTFFFNPDLTFTNVNNFMVTYLLNNFYIKTSYFPIIFWSGISLSSVTLLVSWWRNKFNKTTLFLAFSFLSMSLMTVIFGAPIYIYTHFIIVGYHFVTWLIFYFIEMWRRGRQVFNKFLIINTAVFLIFILIAYSHFSVDKNTLGAFFFDYRVFTIFTYIHISTSFMNDDWFKSFEQKLANYFS